MSWCPIDSSYLLTCAKDNRTICWDTISGEVGEMPISAFFPIVVYFCFEHFLFCANYFGFCSAMMMVLFLSILLQIVCELPAGTNWNFDIHWYPKIPGVISASSFDGKIGIYNIEVWLNCMLTGLCIRYFIM